jgi:predicted HTH transcriptional regulator
MELKKLIRGGETNTVELKVAAPRAVEMAERLCGMANAQGGLVIIGVNDASHEFVVTFRKAPVLVAPQTQPQRREMLWGDDQDVLPEILAENQSDQRERRLAKAVEYVQKYGFITNSIYRELTGVSDRTAHRDLETLIELGG